MPYQRTAVPSVEIAFLPRQLGLLQLASRFGPKGYAYQYQGARNGV